MSNKEITVEEWCWILNRINKIEQILNLRTTIPRAQSPKYGNITDLNFANEMIDSQRKTIKELKTENILLKQKPARINQSIDNMLDELDKIYTGTPAYTPIKKYILDLKEEIEEC